MRYEVKMNSRSWKTRGAVVPSDATVGFIETPLVQPGEGGEAFALTPQEIADGLRNGLFTIKAVDTEVDPVSPVEVDDE